MVVASGFCYHPVIMLSPFVPAGDAPTQAAHLFSKYHCETLPATSGNSSMRILTSVCAVAPYLAGSGAPKGVPLDESTSPRDRLRNKLRTARRHRRAVELSAQISLAEGP